MQIGLLTREGRHLVGQIGPLALAWDRHEGGKLCVSYRVGDKSVPVGDFTIHVKLEEAALCSAYDPDPRLIPVEAGPHRLALRAVQRLYDADRIHLGDAMQETWAWSDGSLYLNAMLRVINPERGGRLNEAAARFTFADGWSSAGGEDIHLVHKDGGHLAVLRYGDGGLWTAPPGEEDPDWSNRAAWEMVGDRPSYYRRWGPYYEQWGGPAGWISLDLEDGSAVRAVWVEGESRDRDSYEAFEGTLALLAADDEEALARKVRSFKHLLTPSVEGGKVLYHSPMEGTTAIRKTGECLKVTFPADPEERQARLHIRGARGRRSLRVSGNTPMIGFPVTDGDVSDDPNGPNLLRPDDRHGPILTDADVRPDELLTTVSLSADRATEVELTSAPGLWMAGQQWDDRQNLLLFSSAHPRGTWGHSPSGT